MIQFVAALIAQYQAYYMNNPTLIVGSRTFVAFGKPEMMIGCRVFCGNFEFGIYLE